MELMRTRQQATALSLVLSDEEIAWPSWIVAPNNLVALGQVA